MLSAGRGRDEGGRQFGLSQSKLALWLLALSLAYFLAARLGIATSLPPEGIVTLWPPNAVVLFALLSLGRDKWPFIFGVTLAIEMAADVPDYPLWAAAGYGVVNFSEAALAALLLSSFGGFRQPIQSVGHFIRFIVAGPIVASGLAALAGAAIYKAGSPDIDYFHYWRIFWIGDAIGLLIFGTGLLALHWPPRRLRNAGPLTILEAAAGAAALVAASRWAFFGDLDKSVIYLVFPFLLWASVRFGSYGASFALLITVTSAIVAAKAELGPFADMLSIDRVIYLQGLIAVAALSAFILAFSSEESWRRRVELEQALKERSETQDRLRTASRQLEELNRELDSLVRSRTAALEESLSHNRLLLQELHHRVKNNLQMVASLVAAQSGTNTAAVLSEKLRTQISAIAATYDVLHRLEDHGDVDFCQVVAELCEGFRTMSVGNISCRIATDATCTVSSQHAVGLALALNELVTNAIKHATCKAADNATVTVRCDLDGERLILRIDDNGGGFPPGIDPRDANGFGLRMVRMMAEQAAAELRFISAPSGSTVELRISPSTSTGRPR